MTRLWIKGIMLLVMFGLMVYAVWKRDWPQAIFWIICLEVSFPSKPL